MVAMVTEHVLCEVYTKAEKKVEYQACDTLCVQVSMEHTIECVFSEAEVEAEQTVEHPSIICAAYVRVVMEDTVQSMSLGLKSS
jgi:hypothetical protein